LELSRLGIGVIVVDIFVIDVRMFTNSIENVLKLPLSIELVAINNFSRYMTRFLAIGSCKKIAKTP
jgi:hypothetical protein